MDNILELKNLTKVYEGGILANHNISFDVREGEIHAIVGENGAGKSTLMKMLYGIENVTSGQIILRGEEVRFASGKDAIAHGIGMVHQHFMLIESFTGVENLMLGLKGDSFLTHAKKELSIMDEAARLYGFSIDCSRRVRDMGVGMKQKLEILKILFRGAKIIILDEPTAVLTPQETEELFIQLKELKRHGMTILFISHKLSEVKILSDRVTVLKGGCSLGTYETASVSIRDISNLMVGREISFVYEKAAISPTQTILNVDSLHYTDEFGVHKLKGISFNVQDSEIVGIAGVEGNGQTELVGIVTANLACQSGKVCFGDEDITNCTIKQVREIGVSYIPEDRMHNGCAASMSVQENMIASNIDDFTNKLGLLDQQRIGSYCEKQIQDYSIVTTREIQQIKNLSGGNIQKVIVAREFGIGNKLLILDQPTRGVDIGAISFIHQKILEMRERKCGMLLVSADLSELLALSDRIVVLYHGEIVAEFRNNQLDEKELGLYMLGLKRQSFEQGGYEKNEASCKEN